MNRKYFLVSIVFLTIVTASFCLFISNSTIAVQTDGLLKALQAIGFAPVAITGQLECYDQNGNEIDCVGTGQDGEYQKGIACPVPRFTDNEDGTVTDNMTGLIWLQQADRFGLQKWSLACEACNNLSADGEVLKDGSEPGDWRLANVKELQSLIDYGQPNLTPYPPFINVRERYFSSTTVRWDKDTFWMVNVKQGITKTWQKDWTGGLLYAWCVRYAK